LGVTAFRIVNLLPMRTTQRRDIATARAIARFTAMGYDVAIPLTEFM
jgi:hypothetical protein